jgi:hypothetical protein
MTLNTKLPRWVSTVIANGVNKSFDKLVKIFVIKIYTAFILGVPLVTVVTTVRSEIMQFC